MTRQGLPVQCEYGYIKKVALLSSAGTAGWQLIMSLELYNQDDDMLDEGEVDDEISEDEDEVEEDEDEEEDEDL